MLFSGLMMMARGSLLGLLLQHRSGDPRGVIEDESPAVYAGRQEDARSAQGHRERHRPLGRAHPVLAQEPPHRQHTEDPQGHEGQQLVGFHHPVDRVAVLDMLLGLQSREHRGRAAERAEDQGVETGLTKGRATGRRGDEIEEHRRDEQRGGQVVERGMQPGPVVAEHRSPQRPRSMGTGGSDA